MHYKEEDNNNKITLFINIIITDNKTKPNDFMNIVQNGINAINNITPITDNYKNNDEYPLQKSPIDPLDENDEEGNNFLFDPLEELKHYATLAYYTYGKDNLDTFDENLAAANLCLIAREDENDIDEVLIALFNPLEKGVNTDISEDFYTLESFPSFYFTEYPDWNPEKIKETPIKLDYVFMEIKKPFDQYTAANMVKQQYSNFINFAKDKNKIDPDACKNFLKEEFGSDFLETAEDFNVGSKKLIKKMEKSTREDYISDLTPFLNAYGENTLKKAPNKIKTAFYAGKALPQTKNLLAAYSIVHIIRGENVLKVLDSIDPNTLTKDEKIDAFYSCNKVFLENAALINGFNVTHNQETLAISPLQAKTFLIETFNEKLQTITKKFDDLIFSSGLDKNEINKIKNESAPKIGNDIIKINGAEILQNYSKKTEEPHIINKAIENNKVKYREN